MLAAGWGRGECSESSLIEDDEEEEEDVRGFEPLLRLCAKFFEFPLSMRVGLKIF